MAGREGELYQGGRNQGQPAGNLDAQGVVSGWPGARPEFHETLRDRLSKPPQDGVLQRDDLAAAFAYRAAWDRTEWLPILEERVRKTLPPTAFLYQWTMSALGENPRYANPNSFLTRALAMLFAFAKYLFLGVFVALVMDEIGRSTSRKET